MGKYDKLIKESLSYLIKPFAERIGIDFKNKRLEMIKDKLQQTLEREPDFLFIVRHPFSLDDYVTQFDFQVPNDMAMPERMLMYRCFVKYTYNLPVRQIVFYLGNDPLEMVNFIKEPNTYHQFELYDIRMFTANSFLKSDIPQEVLLAILGDFEGENPEMIMEKILTRLQLLVKQKKKLQKLTFQLHVLSGLRNLRKIFQLKIKNMPLQFDIDLKSDPFFLEGREEGKEEGIEIGTEKGIEIGMTKKDFENVSNFLLNTDFSDERIAFLLNVKLTFIDEVRTKIKNKIS
jgi:predicted transposase YdaD